MLKKIKDTIWYVKELIRLAKEYFSIVEDSINKLSNLNEGLLSKLPPWTVQYKKISIGVTLDGEGFFLKAFPSIEIDEDCIEVYYVDTVEVANSILSPIRNGRKKMNIQKNGKTLENASRCILLGVLFFIISPSALADALIPSVMVIMPIMGLLLIPIIIIEAYFFQKIVKVNWKLSFKVTILSNLFSTLVGIPFAWVASFLSTFSLTSFFVRGERACIQAAWLPLPTGGFTTDWADKHHALCNLSTIIAAIFMVFCFFLISWFSEYWISRWLMRKTGMDKNKINRAVGWGNCSSYLFLCIVIMLMFHLY